ncbi:MAG: pilus assembly protein TadG-related protein [Pseudomonadota bacterium]
MAFFIEQSASKMGRDDNGHVAVIFALTVIPIVVVAGFAVDFQQTSGRKVQVQAAVDAAVIAGARSMQEGFSNSQIEYQIKSYINSMISTEESSLSCDEPEIDFPEDTQDITVDIKCYQKTSLTAVVGEENIEFDISSTSTWGIGKLDVAFMLDVSGSMNSENRLTNLKSSSLEAVSILLPEDAPEELIENTRIAMSTYNSMVDAGPFFEEVAGKPPTRTYTHEIHGDEPELAEDGELDDNFRVRLWDADNNSVLTEFGDGSVIYVPDDLIDNLNITVEVRSGGEFTNGDVDSMHFAVSGEISSSQTENYSPYAVFGDNGGNLNEKSFDYGEYELRYRVYENNNLNGKLYDKTIEFEIIDEGDTETKSKTITSTCVWERDGDNAFNAAKPEEDSYLSHREAWFEEDEDHSNGGVWKVGHPEKAGDSKYDGDECRAFPPVELTNDRTTLENYVNSLTAGGGTAGHLGIGWSWYLIAPEWKDLFSEEAEPMSYEEPDAIKAVILMTDGEFNRQIFDDQGDSDEQSEALCDNMKEKDIVIYAIALQAPPAGQEILEYCSSGPAFYFDAQNGQQLTDAYRAIATSLSDLRLKY